MIQSSACAFCRQIAGDQTNDLISQMLGGSTYVRRVAMESDHFAVIPSLGGLVPGHCLLCPKEHFRSLASLPSRYDTDYRELKVRLIQVLETLFSRPVVCFEHGSSTDKRRVLCSVEHAHLHLLPFDTAMSRPLDAQLLWEAVGPRLTDLQAAVGSKEYLYWEFPGAGGLISKRTQGFRSQLLRQVVANAIGCPGEWNWRKTPKPRAADDTYNAVCRGVISSDNKYTRQSKVSSA